MKRKAQPANMASVTTISSNSLFRVDRDTERPDAYYMTELMNNGKRFKKTERGNISREIPEILEQSKLHSEETLNAAGLHYLGGDYKVVKLHSKYGHRKKLLMDITEAKLFSETDLEQLGLIGTLAEAQALLLQPGMDKKMVQYEREGYTEERGNGYNIGFSVQPTHKEGAAIKVGQIACQNDPDIAKVLRILAPAAHKVLENVDGGWTEAHRQASIQTAWMTCGHQDNHSITSMQINLSNPNLALKTALKTKGHVHVDRKDERRVLSVVFFLSYFPEGCFPGYFTVTDLGLTCVSAPFTALVFDANHPHGGSGVGYYPDDLPEDSTLRYHPPAGFIYPKLPEGSVHRRCLSIAYAQQSLTVGRTHEIAPDIYKPISLTCFGAIENFMKWYVRNKIMDMAFPVIGNPTAEDLYPQLIWTDEDGNIHLPNIDIIREALAMKGKENKKWEDMKEASLYLSTFLAGDSGDYNWGRRQKERKRMLESGELRKCDFLIGKEDAKRRCAITVTQSIEGATRCRLHMNK
jgi:hypothetical protein